MQFNINEACWIHDIRTPAKSLGDALDAGKEFYINTIDLNSDKRDSLRTVRAVTFGGAYAFIATGTVIAEMIPGQIMNAYEGRINALGNVGGNILYSLGYGVQQAPSAQAPSMSSRTVAVAAPKAIATSATSTGGAPPGNGNTTAGVVGASNQNIVGQGNPTTTYTVRSGDTLGNIGSRYGTTAAAIGAANGIQNLNLIHPGQVLIIPRR